MSMEKYQLIFGFLGLSFLAGMGFTAGMWLFCKAARWAPVNTGVVVHVPDATGEIRREKVRSV